MTLCTLTVAPPGSKALPRLSARRAVELFGLLMAGSYGQLVNAAQDCYERRLLATQASAGERGATYSGQDEAAGWARLERLLDRAADERRPSA